MRGESELGHKTFVFFADSVKNNAFSLKASIEHSPETVVCGIGLLLSSSSSFCGGSHFRFRLELLDSDSNVAVPMCLSGYFFVCLVSFCA